MTLIEAAKEVERLTWTKREFGFFDEISWRFHGKAIKSGELYPLVNLLNSELRESSSKKRYVVDFGGDDKKD